MKRREFQFVVEDEKGIEAGLEWARQLLRRGLRGGPAAIFIGRPRRTRAQNDKLWAVLGDVSRQVDWYGNKLSTDEWKDVFTAALKQQKTVPGIEGGFVVLGARTSDMDKKELSELIELALAFGDDHGITWTEVKEEPK